MFDELLSPLLTGARSRRVGLLVLTVMIILLLVMFFHVLSSLHADIKLLQSLGTKKTFSTTDNGTVGLITQIPEWHLFGKYAVMEKTDVLPVTSLQLQLIGVIKATPETFSRVIISEAGQPGKVYQTGDKLSSGVRIYAISEDGVILENEGRLEKLLLRRSPLLFRGLPESLLGE